MLGSKEVNLLMDVATTVRAIQQELSEFKELTLQSLAKLEAAWEEVRKNPTPQNR